MPINKLILTMSIPMMISMLIQALYNIIDSMFVAQISENALTAVSLAFPAQNLMIAVATGTGVGINATLSRSLGERNFKRAKNTHCSWRSAASLFLQFSVPCFQEPISCSRQTFRRSWNMVLRILGSAPFFLSDSSLKSLLSVFYSLQEKPYIP